ncbi:hypothetical protein FACS1894139_08910 [Planctomycetales bacterium]|nr:hypothetical protein FACS1894108_05840 [Planctomycetales bacterium]GHT05314.1 hypothetical protein FACS1894139_08910 [Planctomycetales bacterium]
MKKTRVLWIVLALIFLVIFNTAFFAAGGFDHPASVWISYGFIHFAYLMLLLTPALFGGGKSAAVFGFALYSVSATYFLLEFVIGVVFILIAADSYKATLIVQLIIAGLYGITLIANLIANEYTADAEEKRAPQIEYVKRASAELKIILDRVSDKAAKKKVEKVCDTLYSSPVKSHPDLAPTESQILLSISSLKDAVSAGETAQVVALADSLLIAINERNRQLKIIG